MEAHSYLTHLKILSIGNIKKQRKLKTIQLLEKKKRYSYFMSLFDLEFEVHIRS